MFKSSYEKLQKNKFAILSYATPGDVGGFIRIKHPIWFSFYTPLKRRGFCLSGRNK